MRLHLANANFAKYLYIFVLAKLYYIGVFYHYAPPIYYNAMGSTVNDDSTIRTLCTCQLITTLRVAFYGFAESRWQAET